MTDTDKAARRTAINLMRLNEALELRDAEHRPPRQFIHRALRVKAFYKDWFTRVGMRKIP